MRISKKSQYGLRAMVYLAKFPGKIFSLKKISKAEGIPFDYLEKIFSKLEKAGLIKAKKGVRGGYFLAKKPEKIKIGEVIKALEGQTVLVSCFKSFCPLKRKCLAKNFWQKLNQAINFSLNSVTLADLIKK